MTDPFQENNNSSVQNSSLPCLTMQKSVSRINNMTVGDVRQCFHQMRNTPNLTASTVLWCGVTAGKFALSYLLQTAHSTSRRRRSKYTTEKHTTTT